MESTVGCGFTGTDVPTACLYCFAGWLWIDWNIGICLNSQWKHFTSALELHYLSLHVCCYLVGHRHHGSLKVTITDMSWYTTPAAEYIILALNDASSSSSSLSIRPCDVRNYLIGFKVGNKQPLNEVSYSPNKKKPVSFEVVEVSVGCKTKELRSNIEAVVTRSTQVFLIRLRQSSQNRMFCLSPSSSSWYLDIPYSERDCLVALKLHDPTVASSIIGDFSMWY